LRSDFLAAGLVTRLLRAVTRRRDDGFARDLALEVRAARLLAFLFALAICILP
jgi:hypothetical protein